MKYLIISPGLCVQPTMEKPELHEYRRDIHGDEAYRDDMREYEQHIASLPKLPTTCTLPAGEWFDCKEQYEVLEPTPPDGDLKWVNRGKDEYNKFKDCEGVTRILIVPVEQKDEPVEQKDVLPYLEDIRQRFGRFLIAGGIDWWPNLRNAIINIEINAYKAGLQIQDAYRDQKERDGKVAQKEPVEQEGCVDLQKQIETHIRDYKMFDWHEALTENEMSYLVDLMLTFNPDRWWESPKQSPRLVKIEEALSELVHLHSCEQEGLRPPTPEMWMTAVNKAADALSTELTNNI